jgi:zinc transporter ZupT
MPQRRPPVTFSLSALLLAVALILFVLAAIPIPEPYSGRLVPLGLAFLAGGFLSAAVAVP